MDVSALNWTSQVVQSYWWEPWTRWLLSFFEQSLRSAYQTNFVPNTIALRCTPFPHRFWQRCSWLLHVLESTRAIFQSNNVRSVDVTLQILWIFGSWSLAICTPVSEYSTCTIGFEFWIESNLYKRIHSDQHIYSALSSLCSFIDFYPMFTSFVALISSGSPKTLMSQPGW